MTSCCVCGLESSGAHSCSSCLQDVHVICGKINGDEGWGCSVLCNNCATEPPAKKTSTWSIAYPSRSQELKHKVPNLKQQTEKSEWKTHCVCLTCFENGMEPNIYVMSSRDSSTKNRHVLRRHPQVTLSQISIVNFDSNGKEVSLAREKYYASTSNDKCKKNSSKTQGTLFNFCFKPVGEDSPTFICNNKKDASRSNKVKIPHTEATKVICQGAVAEVKTPDTEPTTTKSTAGGLVEADCEDTVPHQSHSCTCKHNTNLLNSNMDEMIRAIKEFKIKTSTPAPTKPVIS
ncbi:Hypothetical predicted protein [Paramuricea clavata]|uniref:SCAN domain-containing protein n=1 Tax=Paramuricea clavata TaxID=317549 RepID=A0A7D9EYK6_PARCT|nr:Hypothetical predicted protein [Paramuricea clavata]